jgi:hypothetical protein
VIKLLCRILYCSVWINVDWSLLIVLYCTVVCKGTVQLRVDKGEQQEQAKEGTVHVPGTVRERVPGTYELYVFILPKETQLFE